MKTLFIIYLFLLISINGAKEKVNRIDAELITDVKSIQPGKDFYVALKLSAPPDWHTYWRNPGDSGLPTSIKWNLPGGFKHGEIEWPAPHLFIVEGITNYGYEKEELLLVKISPPETIKPNENVVLIAEANWLACRIECVPESKSLSVILPVKLEKPETDNNISNAFNAARKKMPLKDIPISFKASLNENSVIITGESNSLNMKDLNNIRFFPNQSGYYNNSSKQILFKNKNYFTLQVFFDDFKIGIPENVNGVIYNENGWNKDQSKSIEINVNLSE